MFTFAMLFLFWFFSALMIDCFSFSHRIFFSFQIKPISEICFPIFFFFCIQIKNNGYFIGCKESSIRSAETIQIKLFNKFLFWPKFNRACSCFLLIWSSICFRSHWEYFFFTATIKLFRRLCTPSALTKCTHNFLCLLWLTL